MIDARIDVVLTHVRVGSIRCEEIYDQDESQWWHDPDGLGRIQGPSLCRTYACTIATARVVDVASCPRVVSVGISWCRFECQGRLLWLRVLPFCGVQ